jgi:hypothetical protein
VYLTLPLLPVVLGHAQVCSENGHKYGFLGKILALDHPRPNFTALVFGSELWRPQYPPNIVQVARNNQHLPTTRCTTLDAHTAA